MKKSVVLVLLLSLVLGILLSVGTLAATNTSFNTAAAINMDTTYSGSFSSSEAGKERWYKFTIPSSGKVKISGKSAVGGDISFYDSDS